MSPEDPFENLNLDEDFVRGAPVKEPSASVRRLRDEQLRERERVIQLRSARRARRRRRAARLSRRAAVVVFLAAVVGGAWITSRDESNDTRPPGVTHADIASSEVSLAGGLPPPSAEEQPAPIGAPPPLPAGGGPYKFLRSQVSGSAPVAYDPCRPVHVVVNDGTGTAPPESGQLLRSALERLSAATGLRFVEDGATTEAAVSSRAPYQPERYPDRWAPVLIAWSDDVADPRLDGNVAGYAGSISITAPASTDGVYVTGQVVLDGPQFDDILNRLGGVAAARGILLHELGHLVGLDHVDDPAQLMNPVGSPRVTDYAKGDRTGLALLGRGTCFPTI